MSIKIIRQESASRWRRAILDASALSTQTPDDGEQKQLRAAMEWFQRRLDAGAVYPGLYKISEEAMTTAMQLGAQTDFSVAEVVHAVTVHVVQQVVMEEARKLILESDQFPEIRSMLSNAIKTELLMVEKALTTQDQ